MAKQTIDIGSSADDDTGDPLRTGLSKANANFTELYPLANIAALTALTKASLTDGDRRWVLGYSTAGDWGEPRMATWDSSSTDTADGGTRFASDEGGNGRWDFPFSGPINVKWFGVKGDGTTADEDMLSAVLAGGGHFVFPAGSYRLVGDKTTVLTADLTLDFDQDAELLFDTGYFELIGEEVATSLTLAANAARYATSITLNDGTGVQAGDLVYVTTSVIAETSWNHTKKDVSRIRSASGDELELEEPLYFPYDTADSGLTITIYRPHKVRTNGLKVRSSGAPTTAMLLLTALNDITINGLRADNSDGFAAGGLQTGQALLLRSVFNAFVDHVYVSNLQYPIMVQAGARNVTIRDITARNCRHAVSPTDWPVNVNIHGLNASDCYAAIDSHPAFNVHYKDVHVERDEQLSNLRSVGGSLRKVRVHTLESTSATSYFQSLAGGITSTLYTDSDFLAEDIEIVAPAKSSGNVLGCANGRSAFFRNVRVPLPLNIGAIVGGARLSGITVTQAASGSRSVDANGAVRRSDENPLVNAYLDTQYHIDARRINVDAGNKYMRCYGSILTGYNSADPAVITIRIHTNVFSTHTPNRVFGILRLKGAVRHSNSGSFDIQSNEYHFYQQVLTTSFITWPTTPSRSDGLTGQSNESLTIALGSVAAAGASQLGTGDQDYYVETEVTLTSGRTNPVYQLTYDLELFCD